MTVRAGGQVSIPEQELAAHGGLKAYMNQNVFWFVSGDSWHTVPTGVQGVGAYLAAVRKACKLYCDNGHAQGYQIVLKSLDRTSN